jgi:hypothetical protein
MNLAWRLGRVPLRQLTPPCRRWPLRDQRTAVARLLTVTRTCQVCQRSPETA